MTISEETRIPGEVITKAVEMFRAKNQVQTIMDKLGLTWDQVYSIKQLKNDLDNSKPFEIPQKEKEVVPVWMGIRKEFHYDKEEEMFGLPSYSFDSLSVVEKEIFYSLK